MFLKFQVYEKSTSSHFQVVLERVYYFHMVKN